MDLSALQQFSDFRKGLHEFSQSLNLLNLVVTLLLFTIYTLIYASRRKRDAEETWGYYILIGFTFLCYFIAAFADELFTKQNVDDIYTNFFSNLGTEFLAFLILIMCTPELTTLLQQCSFKLTAAIAVLVLCMVALNDIAVINNLPAMDVPHFHKIMSDIITEFLTIPLTLALLILIQLIQHSSKEHFFRWYQRVGLIILIVLPVIIVVPVIMLALHHITLAIAIIGGIFTFVTMNEIVAQNNYLKFTAVCIYGVLIVALLANFVELPMHANVAISAELYGALLPVILIR